MEAKLFFRLAIVFLTFCTLMNYGADPTVTDVEIVLPDSSRSDYLKLRYSVFDRPLDRGVVIQDRLLALVANVTNGVFVSVNLVVATNSNSEVVAPIRLRETPSGDLLNWADELLLASKEYEYVDVHRYSYSGLLAYKHDIMIGFKHLEADGVHFGWARAHGDYYALGTYYQMFDTNTPPTFLEVVVNPVPWAETILGRKSSGGPTLSNSPLPGSQLRLSYPGWCDRYAIRQRNRPKGEIVKVFPSGREGLVATNGYYSIDVPLSGEAGLFELFLPQVNRMP